MQVCHKKPFVIKKEKKGIKRFKFLQPSGMVASRGVGRLIAIPNQWGSVKLEMETVAREYCLVS